MKRLTALSLLLLAFSFTACEKNTLGTIDVNTNVPQLSNPSVTPDSVYLDALTPSGGTYTVNATVSVRSSLRDGEQTVEASLLRPGGNTVALRIVLRDNGAAPDAAANDGIFSGAAHLSLTRGQAGLYRVQVQSRTADGLMSNALQLPLKLARRNSAPQLLAVSLPDTITLPTTDTIRVLFTASVADSDGLGDIGEVFFRRISPPDPTKFIMKDDGGLDPPIGVGGIPLRSGDFVAGDGTFSFQIPVLPTSTRRTNVFRFQCIDSFGDTSLSVERSFTIR